MTDDNENGWGGLGAGCDSNEVPLQQSGAQPGGAKEDGHGKMIGGVGEDNDEVDGGREAMLESLRLRIFIATEEGDTEAVEMLLQQVASVSVDYDTVCALGAEVRHVKGAWDGTSLYGWGDEEEEEEEKKKEEEEEERVVVGREQEDVCRGKKRVRKRDLKRIKELAASIIEGWAAVLIPKYHEEVSGKSVHDLYRVVMRAWLFAASLKTRHIHTPNAEICSQSPKPVLQSPKLLTINSRGFTSRDW